MAQNNKRQQVNLIVEFTNKIIRYCQDTQTNKWIIKHIKQDISNLKQLAEYDEELMEGDFFNQLRQDILKGRINLEGAIASLCLYYQQA